MARFPVVLGTGSFVPPTVVDNKTMMQMLRPYRSDNGEEVVSSWLERHLGIRERRLDLEIQPGGAFRKKARADGGLFDGDFAVNAGLLALEDASVNAREIDVLVHVSCTPDTVACWDHIRYIYCKLGLRSDCTPDYKNLGCAGLASGFGAANMHIRANGSGRSIRVLLIASNAPSCHMSSYSLSSYVNYARLCAERGIKDETGGWGWTSPAVFGDGASAAVFQLNGQEGRGLITSNSWVSPEHKLIVTPAGGCLEHAMPDNAWRQLFLMNAPLVGKVYPTLMARNYEHLLSTWDKSVAPVVGHAFDINRVKRFYFHQANGLAVHATATQLNVPLIKVPLNVDRYGNTSAPSTLILFDEDRKAGHVSEGDLVVFMWIGAGVGAMNGYAVFVV